MPINTEYDAITNRKYIVMNSNDFDASNYTYTFLASYKNELRFINEDNVLVRVKGATPTETGNKLAFTLDAGHTFLKLDCLQCDNQRDHSFFYGLDSYIEKNKDIMELSSIQSWYTTREPLTLHLNNEQAIASFNAISHLMDLSAKGEYKYIPTIHNCVSLLTDTYKQSGFSGDLADYHTDSEIMHSLTEGKGAFIYKHYNPSHAEMINPHRAEITNFIKSIYGDDYKKNWYFFNDDPMPTKGIKYTPIDQQKAALNPTISAVIQEIMQIREEVIPQLIEIGLKAWEGYHDFSPTLIKGYADALIHTPITYNNLHYDYVLTHEMNIANIFKDEPYAKELINIFGDAGEGIVLAHDDYYHSFNSIASLIDEQCDASHMEIWGDVHQF